ncbi:4-pyridoxate dehydrogenase-like [Dermacentor andersoni]|uniref:4-pyridoxate dehydrogenase-like n=1 Tax=Dermacentor andersoni TaxID=34620 RepID=UPI003B3B01ED
MVVHVPFKDLPVVEDYELGKLRPEYDYVIVYITGFHPAGGGSAGCVIANRLSEDPDVTVLLLEAGGLETASRQVPFAAPMNIRGDDDWDYWSVPQKNAALSFHEQRLSLSRGKALGGSSVLNFMLYTRGNPRDYDRWAREYGANGWAYEDVLPHFREIEDYRVGPPDEYHGIGGEVPVDYANTTTRLTELLLEACRQSGYSQVDYNGRTQSGCSQVHTNVANGERFSASKAFIQSIVGTRENLHVALFSHVTKVNFEGSRAVGVSFTRFGQPGTVLAKREVILSAGTVGSTQLLLLSGLGPKEDLKRLQIPVVADLPVGRNLQDHPSLPLGVPIRTDFQAGIAPFSLEDIAQYARNRTGMTQATGPNTEINSSARLLPSYTPTLSLSLPAGTISIPAGIEFLQFLVTNYAADPDIPDVEVATISTSPASETLKRFMTQLGLLPEAFDSYIGSADGQPGFRAITILNRPRSRGSITLRSTDPYEHPNIDPRILEHPDDVRAAAQDTVQREKYKPTDVLQLVLHYHCTATFSDTNKKKRPNASLTTFGLHIWCARSPAGTKIFIDMILSTDAMKSIGAKLWDLTFPPCSDSGPRWSEQYVECLFRHTALPIWHLCCTVAMGSHSEAVLDERLRVRGNVTGLRVADASVMPDIVSGHTNAPSMMIGSKAAAMIIEDNQERHTKKRRRRTRQEYRENNAH